MNILNGKAHRDFFLSYAFHKGWSTHKVAQTELNFSGKEQRLTNIISEDILDNQETMPRKLVLLAEDLSRPEHESTSSWRPAFV